MDAASGAPAPAPATIIEEIPDSALPSDGVAETLAVGTFNLLASFVRYAVAPTEHHHLLRAAAGPAPIVQPVPATRADKPRKQTSRPERVAQAKRVAHDRPKPAEHKSAVNKSSSPKGSKKKK